MVHSPGRCWYQPLHQDKFTPRNYGLPLSIKYLQSSLAVAWEVSLSLLLLGWWLCPTWGWDRLRKGKGPLGPDPAGVWPC